MNPWAKTALYLTAAAGLALSVYATRPVSKDVAMLSDVGKPLAPALESAVKKDPASVKSLEVISYDQQAAKVRAFKVAFDGTRWSIPSHSGYPADAADKVARAAAAFDGLVRERLVTEKKSDHASLGVLAPDDETAIATGAQGVGTRVTMRDAAGQPLADLIIGKAVEDPAASQFSAPSSRRYVREAAGDRVYVASLGEGFSTKFVDWVETDLLRVNPEQVVGVMLDQYKIDQQAGRFTDVTNVTLTRPPNNPADPNALRPWMLTTTPGGGLDPGQILNAARVDELLTTLSGLRIVGVRRKPANLAKVMADPSGDTGIGVAEQISLRTRGFFVSPEGRLLSNEGQLIVQCADGVTYTLWIGEAVPDSEDAASGGQVGGATGDQTPRTSTGTARYMMVMAVFDPATLPPSPTKPAALIDAEAKLAAASDDAAKAQAQQQVQTLSDQFKRELLAWQSRKDAGEKRAQALANRFADWYYVIDAGSLEKLRPTRAQLQMAPPAAPPPGNVNTPGIRLPANLPPGVTIEPIDKPPFLQDPAPPPPPPPPPSAPATGEPGKKPN
jgi:hypothetical protein